MKEIQSLGISLKFPKFERIRREANLIEDIFHQYYLQPNVNSIPDEIEPLFPRIMLTSFNNHSQILFSQIAVDFNVNFSEEYKYDYSLCEKYIKTRMSLVYDFLRKVNIDKLYYIGITSQVKFIIDDKFDEIEYLKKRFLPDYTLPNLYDFSQKITLLEDDYYFHNLSISNYRDYRGDIINSDLPAIISFEKAINSEKGIVITLDINNRYLYSIMGKLTETSKLEEILDYMYSKNKQWLDDRMFNYLPIIRS